MEIDKARAAYRSPSLLEAFAGSILMVVLDGWLTYIAIRRLGIECEGNPLLQILMFSFGIGPSIVASRFLLIICFFSLFAAGERIVMLRLGFLYFGAAIVPWLWILYF